MIEHTRTGALAKRARRYERADSRGPNRTRAFSTIEMAVAVAILLVVSVGVTFTLTRALGQANRAIAQQGADQAATIAFEHAQSQGYQALLTETFTPAGKPCDPETGDPDSESKFYCIKVSNFTYAVSYQIEKDPEDLQGLSTFVVPGEDGARGVDLTVTVTDISTGQTVSRTRLVGPPYAGFGQGTGALRVAIEVEGGVSLPAQKIWLTDFEGAPVSSVDLRGGSATENVVFLVAEGECTREDPCQVGLSGGESWWRSGDDWGNVEWGVAGAANRSGVVITEGAISETTLTVFPAGDIQINLFAETAPREARKAGRVVTPPQDEDLKGSICLWADFIDEGTRRVVPLCNLENVGKVSLSEYELDGNFYLVPSGVELTLSVDHPDGICPAVARMVGHTSSGWDARALCTSWTWGYPTWFGTSGDPTDRFDGARALEIQGGKAVYQYDLIWAMDDDGRPAAGYGYPGEGQWLRPREAPGCALDATCMALGYGNAPEPLECPGSHCYSIASTPPEACVNQECTREHAGSFVLLGDRMHYGISADPGTPLVVEVGGRDAENDLITLTVTEVPEVGELRYLDEDGVEHPVVLGDHPSFTYKPSGHVIQFVYYTQSTDSGVGRLAFEVRDHSRDNSVMDLEPNKSPEVQVNLALGEGVASIVGNHNEVQQGTTDVEVTGTLYDAFAEVVEGATVTFESTNPGIVLQETTAVSDENGLAAVLADVVGVPAGTYQIFIYAEGAVGVATIEVYTTVAEIAGGYVEISQGGGGNIPVTSKDAGGDPTPGAVVDVMSVDGPVLSRSGVGHDENGEEVSVNQGRYYNSIFHKAIAVAQGTTNHVPNPTLEDVTNSSPGWDEDLNGNTIATSWATGYLSEVDDPEIGYHAHIREGEGRNGGYAWAFFDINSQVAPNIQHRPMESSVQLAANPGSSLGWGAGTQVTVSLDVKTDDPAKFLRVGLRHTDNDGVTGGYADDWADLRPSTVGEWERVAATFTLSGADWDFTQPAYLVIEGHHADGGAEARAWADNISVETSATTYGFASGTRLSEVLALPGAGVIHGDAGTIEILFSPVGDPGANGIIFQYGGGVTSPVTEDDIRITWGTNDGSSKIRLRVADDETQTATTAEVDLGSALEPGKWYWVVARWALPGTLELQVHDVADSQTYTDTKVGVTAAPDFEGYSTSAYLGGTGVAGEWANIMVDELRISKVERSNLEVAATLETTQPLEGDPATTLAHHFDGAALDTSKISTSAGCTTGGDGTCSAAITADPSQQSGTYRVRFGSGDIRGYGTITVTQRAAFIDGPSQVTLRQNRTAEVEVQAFDAAGRPLSNSELVFSHTSERFELAEDANEDGSAVIYTNGKGRATVTLVATDDATPGSDTLLVSDGGTQTEVNVVLVAAASSFDLPTLELEPGLARYYEVTVYDGNGLPMPGAQVKAISHHDDVVAGPNDETPYEHEVLTDENGKAQILLISSSSIPPGLEEGLLTVIVDDLDPEVIDATFVQRVFNIAFDEDGYEVAQGASFEITGTAYDNAGDPVNGLAVSPSVHGTISVTTEVGGVLVPVEAVQIGEDGTFTVEVEVGSLVKAGDVEILFTATRGWEEPYDEHVAQPLVTVLATVSEISPIQTPVVLEEGGRKTAGFIVTDSAGDPAQVVDVTVSTDDSEIELRPVLTRDPLAWWRFGELVGTAATDSSGNERTATYNSSFALGATGLLANDSDTAVTFEDDGHLVTDIDIDAELFDFSIGGWVDLVSVGGGEYNLVWGGEGEDEAFYLKLSETGELLVGVGGMEEATGVVLDPGLHHILWTVTTDPFGAEFNFSTIYVDGEFAWTTLSEDIQNGLPSANLTLGGGETGAEVTFDEWAVWNLPLVGSDVRVQYQTGISGSPSTVIGQTGDGGTIETAVVSLGGEGEYELAGDAGLEEDATLVVVVGPSVGTFRMVLENLLENGDFEDSSEATGWGPQGSTVGDTLWIAALTARGGGTSGSPGYATDIPEDYDEENYNYFESLGVNNSNYARIMAAHRYLPWAEEQTEDPGSYTWSNVNWDGGTTAAHALTVAVQGNPTIEGVVGVADPTITNTGTRTLGLPESMEEGELLLMVIRGGGNMTVSTPNGWDLLGSHKPDTSITGSYVLARVVDGTEGSTVTLDVAGTSQRHLAALIYRISGWVGEPEVVFAEASSIDPPELTVEGVEVLADGGIMIEAADPYRGGQYGVLALTEGADFESIHTADSALAQVEPGDMLGASARIRVDGDGVWTNMRVELLDDEKNPLDGGTYLSTAGTWENSYTPNTSSIPLDEWKLFEVEAVEPVPAGAAYARLVVFTEAAGEANLMVDDARLWVDEEPHVVLRRDQQVLVTFEVLDYAGMPLSGAGIHLSENAPGVDFQATPIYTDVDGFVTVALNAGPNAEPGEYEIEASTGTAVKTYSLQVVDSAAGGLHVKYFDLEGGLTNLGQRDGVSVTATGTASGYTPTAVVDGLYGAKAGAGDVWRGAGGTDQSLTFDLGELEGNEIFEIWIHAGGAFPAEIEVFDENSETWESKWELGPGTVYEWENEAVRIPVQESFQRFRIVADPSHTDPVTIEEVRILGAADGSGLHNLVVPGRSTATAFNVLDTRHLAENAIDGDVGSSWATLGGSGAGNWLEIDLGRDAWVHGVVLADRVGPADIHDFTILGRASNQPQNSWSVALTGEDLPGDGTKTYYAFGQPQKLRYIRIETLTTSGTNVGLAEVEVIGRYQNLEAGTGTQFAEGVLPGLNLTDGSDAFGSGRTSNVAMEATGLIRIDEAGEYTFYVDALDQAELEVDGTKLVSYAIGTGMGWSEAVAGDFNGDGIADIAVLDGNTGELWVQLGVDGHGTRRPQKWGGGVQLESGAHITLLVGDFDGDGNDDISWYSESDGEIWVALSAEDSFATPSIWGSLRQNLIRLPGGNGVSAAAGDDASLELEATGEIEVWVRADWEAPGRSQVLAAKSSPSEGSRSWEFILNSDGSLRLVVSEDGVTTDVYSSTKAVSEVARSGELLPVSVRFDLASGDVAFYADGEPLGGVEVGELVSESLAAHYDATSLIFLADGSSVPTWHDRSGNGHHISQATAGNQPTFHTSTFGGRPAVRFDGNDRLWRTTTEGDSLDLRDELTIFLVANPSSWLANTTHMIFKNHYQGTDDQIQFGLSREEAGTIHYSSHQKVISGTDLDLGAPILLNTVWDGEEVSFYHNRELQGTFDVSGTAAFRPYFNVGGRSNQADGTGQGTYNFAGDIAEILIYDRALTDIERNLVEEYLYSKWGLEPPVTEGLSAHYDASTISGLSDGAAVPSWADRSGNGQHVANSNADMQPSFVSNGLNGKPLVRFDGTEHLHKVTAANDSLDIREELSIFALLVPQTTGNGHVIFKNTNTGETTDTQFGFSHQSSTTRMYVGGSSGGFANSGAPFVIGQPLLMEGIWDGDDIHWYHDGVHLTTTPLAANPTFKPNFVIGGRSNREDGSTASNHQTVDIAEILIYDRALTNQERAAVEWYLAAKWYDAHYPWDLNPCSDGYIEDGVAYETFICSSAWTAPAGVTEATVEAWGGGGGGYGRSEDTSAIHRGAGGGGGAYAQSTLTVTPGDSYTVTVGQGGPAAPEGNPDFGDGEPSVFGENLVVAAGGQGAGQTTGGGNSVGGSVANSVGQITRAGGSGGDRGPVTQSGGGGGGAAGNPDGAGAAGQTPTGTSGGAGGVGAAGGGSGGAGGALGQNGQNGQIPGGGGGGKGYNNPARQGGDGARGQVVISYDASVLKNPEALLATLYASDTAVTVGSDADGGRSLLGEIGRVRIWGDLDRGDLRADWNASTEGAGATSITNATTGPSLTLTGVEVEPTYLPTRHGVGVLDLRKSSADHVKYGYVADHPALDLSREFAIEFVGTSNWNADAGTSRTLVSKFGPATSNQRAYVFDVSSDLKLRLFISTNGSNSTAYISTMSLDEIGVEDGDRLNLTVTFEPDAHKSTATFWVNGVQLGAAVEGPGYGSGRVIHDSSAPLLIGTRTDLNPYQYFPGTVERVRIASAVEDGRIGEVTAAWLFDRSQPGDGNVADQVGSNTLTFRAGSSDWGDYPAPATLISPAGTEAHSRVVVGDVDGDEADDLMWLDSAASGTVRVLTGGASSFGDGGTADAGLRGDYQAFSGDINGDGYAELYAWDRTNRTWTIVANTEGALEDRLPLPGVGPVAHYDADAITGLTDNDSVSMWKDISGNANHVTQPTSGARPTYQTDEFAGKGAVTFGSGKRLYRFTSEGDSLDLTAATIFAAVDADADAIGSNAYVVSKTNRNSTSTSSHNQLHLGQVSNKLSGGSWGEARGFDKTFSGNPEVVSTTSDGTSTTNITLHVNGETPDPYSTATATGVFREMFNIGSRSSSSGGTGGGTDNFYGAIGEIIIYDRVLDDAERQAVETRLMGKWLVPNGTNLEPLVGDFNGDTLTDFAWFDADTGNYWVSVSNGTTLEAPVNWGTHAAGDYTHVPGDYNGDGIDDIATRDIHTGEWAVATSDEGEFTVTIWGTQQETADLITAGDFTGDGTTDVAYLKASPNGQWRGIIFSEGTIDDQLWIEENPTTAGTLECAVGVTDSVSVWDTQACVTVTFDEPGLYPIRAWAVVGNSNPGAYLQVSYKGPDTSGFIQLIPDELLSFDLGEAPQLEIETFDPETGVIRLRNNSALLFEGDLRLRNVTGEGGQLNVEVPGGEYVDIGPGSGVIAATEAYLEAGEDLWDHPAEDYIGNIIYLDYYDEGASEWIPLIREPFGSYAISIAGVARDAVGADLNTEHVTIRNDSRILSWDLDGHTLEVSGGAHYEFSEFELLPQVSVRVHSGVGADNFNALYGDFEDEWIPDVGALELILKTGDGDIYTTWRGGQAAYKAAVAE